MKTTTELTHNHPIRSQPCNLDLRVFGYILSWPLHVVYQCTPLNMKTHVHQLKTPKIVVKFVNS